MTFRNHSTILLLLASLTACYPQPAHADVLLDQLPPDPARPGWYAPVSRSDVPMGGVDYDFDPDRGPLLDAHAEDALWLVTPGAWGASTAPLPLPAPDLVRCTPVPGPLPVLGVGAAYAYSRKLRRRIIR
jgi:hypothetical protein